MPHLRLEYSTNILENFEPKDLFSLCYPILVKTIGANLSRCQGRVIPCSHYLIGEGNPHQAYIFLEVLIMEGRKKEQIESMGSEILQLLKNYFQASLQSLNVQIAIRCVEIPSSHYFKFEAKAD